LLLPGLVSAQQITGITVTPGVIKAYVSREEPVTATDITIRNNYSVPVRLSAELKGIDETTAQLIPAGDLDPDLSSVLALSETDITIPPLTDKHITLQSSFNDGLKPGGHYATVVLTEQSSSGAALSVRSAVSITVYLTNREGVKENFDLEKFEARNTLLSLPKEATVTLKNSGNVHSVPRGVIRVENTRGAVLAQGVLNAGSAPVLPGKEFSTVVRLNTVKKAFWPQKARIVLQFHGESSDQLSEATRDFWYIPQGFIAVIVLLATGTFVIVRFGMKPLKHGAKSLKRKATDRKRRQKPKQQVPIHDVMRVDSNRGKKR